MLQQWSYFLWTCYKKTRPKLHNKAAMTSDIRLRKICVWNPVGHEYDQKMSEAHWRRNGCPSAFGRCM